MSEDSDDKAPRLPVVIEDGETESAALTRVMLDPFVRNGHVASTFGSRLFGDRLLSSMEDSVGYLTQEAAKVGNGDLALVSRMHTSQALSLDAIYTEMARMAGVNMGHHPEAFERYMRLALKAQSACRTTLDALTRLHQPREQTVKHVHVNEGGQAVVADHFHHHQNGASANGKGKSADQSDATGATDAVPALRSADAAGSGVQIPGGQRKEAVPHARRNKPRRAEG